MLLGCVALFSWGGPGSSVTMAIRERRLGRGWKVEGAVDFAAEGVVRLIFSSGTLIRTEISNTSLD